MTRNRRYVRDASIDVLKNSIKRKTIGYLEESENDLEDVIDLLNDLPNDKKGLVEAIKASVQVLNDIIDNLDLEINQLETKLDELD